MKVDEYGTHFEMNVAVSFLLRMQTQLVLIINRLVILRRAAAATG